MRYEQTFRALSKQHQFPIHQGGTLMHFSLKADTSIKYPAGCGSGRGQNTDSSSPGDSAG